MPFANSIAGGNGSLVRTQLQSGNYVAGVSGWRIGKDGSAEFNNGTFRGSITAGNPAGQHFVLNNPSTGDAIDVYDTLNRLVFKLDSTGGLFSINQPGTNYTQLFSAALVFSNLNVPPFSAAGMVATSNGFGSQVQIDSGHGTSGSGDANITYSDSLDSGTNRSALTAFQGSDGVSVAGVNGNLVQNDVLTGLNYMVHFGTYTATTFAPGGTSAGNWTVAHGCNFTPNGVIAFCNEASSASFNQTANFHSFVGGNVTLTIMGSTGVNVAPTMLPAGQNEVVFMLFYGNT
jgi:hypothetical protein